MRKEATLRVAAEHRMLSRIRDFVAAKAEAAGARLQEIQSLVQAVDEAATNVIVHGYQELPGIIEVRISNSSNKIKVRIRDQAPPFDPTQAPEPNLALPLEDRPVGGLGIYMMRHCVDELEYCCLMDGSNELTLIKHIKKK